MQSHPESADNAKFTSQANGQTQPASSESSAVPADVVPSGSRRQFLRTGSVVSAAAAGGVSGIDGFTRPVRAAEPQEGTPEPIKIGIVGLGGRGSGALNDTLSINDGIQVVATADVNPEAQKVLGRMKDKYGDKVEVASAKNHVGPDSYKRILDDPEIDLVIMTTPPGFRPQYVLDAVEAGKHVFAEKPTCIDPAGYRVCLTAHDKAVSGGTAIVTGTQYRRQVNYMEAIKKIHDGEIGDVISMIARYCSTGIWYKNRREGMSDTEYQVFNWMHFIWLSGDQIAEQAVHNVDVMNWVMQGPPESAYGSGGRFTRPEDSEMWDSMSIDYSYSGGRQVSFKCRQIPGSQSDNSNTIFGSEGSMTIYGGNRGAELRDRNGTVIWEMKGNIGAAYQQEHKDLVDSIRSGAPIVELRQTAESSLTAVMGRLAAYTGKNVDWDFLTEDSKLDLFPKELDFGGPRPEPSYAIPGKTKLI